MLSPELIFWLNVGFKNLNLLVILHCLMEEEVCPVGLHNVGDYQKTDMSFLWNYSLKRAAEGVAEPRFLADGDTVSQIVSTAFEDLSTAGRERALSHFLSEIDDADNIDAQSSVDFLVECGFQDDIPPEAITSIGDSGGAYRLMGIVSHCGTSAQYVAHINTNGPWVTFNDEVGVSKDMGDMYIFEKLYRAI